VPSVKTLLMEKFLRWHDTAAISVNSLTF